MKNFIKLLYIDLFCGAGGTSTGVESARIRGSKCAKVVACVNHDPNAIETKENKFNQSHFIRVSLPKEVYQQLTEEERKQVPIVGNMKVLERPAVQNQEVEAATVASVEPDDGMSIDDLPF